MPVGRSALLLGLALGVTACSQEGVQAPTERGVCWRMTEGAGPTPTFTAISRNIRNLETCAARLEARRMMEGSSVDGAFQGHFIFVTEAQILSAADLESPRFQVFEPAARLEIQKGIQALIDHEAAQEASS